MRYIPKPARAIYVAVLVETLRPYPDPFVLLDDASGGDRPLRLYRRPTAVVEAWTPGEVVRGLDALRNAHAAGLHVAGYLAYEAGAALHPRLPPRAGGRLMWFGLFPACETLPQSALGKLLPEVAAAWIGPVEPRLARTAYMARVAEAQRLIAAGDIYQANLTFTADLPFAGDPLALYPRLRDRQRAAHGAIVALPDETLLSFSPELFFRIEGGEICCRPMKGTAPRRAGRQADDAAAAALSADPKQRAENLMIVDLMRNDLARVAVSGSVAVPALFAVERYPTVHQLVSEVRAQCRPDVGPVDVLAQLFPCGSITGAPKLRAMQVIDAVEGAPRGVYTGTIGHIAPDGAAEFNVAIRTLRHAAGSDRVTLGLGAGIVADSEPAAEWRECLAKARFAVTRPPGFDLIETMRYDPGAGLHLKALHLERLAASARRLRFRLDPVRVEGALDAALRGEAASRRVRLALSPDGAVQVTLADLPPVPERPVTVMAAPRTHGPDDLRFAHKTSDRSVYRRPPEHAAAFDTLFVDRAGFVTEGSFTTVFVARDGVLLTPPLARGVLPGVLRRTLLERGEAIERELRLADCAQGLHIGNALRGLLPAVLVA